MRLGYLLLATAISQAATISVTSGSGATITSNATQTIDIVIADSRPIIGNFFVSLNTFSHTFIGDVSATVTHVNTATTVQLFQRPGRTTSGQGCNSNFNGTYILSDLGATTFGSCVGLSGTNAVLAAGTYRASQDQGATDEAAIAIANFFNTQVANGTWRLTITDSASGDTGTLASWTVNFDVAENGVPEPASAMIVIAGLAAIAIHRARQN